MEPIPSNEEVAEMIHDLSVDDKQILLAYIKRLLTEGAE